MAHSSGFICFTREHCEHHTRSSVDAVFQCGAHVMLCEQMDWLLPVAEVSLQAPVAAEREAAQSLRTSTRIRLHSNYVSRSRVVCCGIVT